MAAALAVVVFVGGAPALGSATAPAAAQAAGVPSSSSEVTELNCIPDNVFTPPLWDRTEWITWLSRFCLDDDYLHRVVPDVFYRGDTRGTDYVFENGFETYDLPPGWPGGYDDDILRHIMEPDQVWNGGVKTFNPDGYVSFTDRWEVAWGFSQGDVYAVDATSEFISVPNSWQRALRESPTPFDYKPMLESLVAAGHEEEEAMEYLTDRFDRALDFVKRESEWVVLGGILPEDIRGKTAWFVDEQGLPHFDEVRPEGDGVAGRERVDNPHHQPGDKDVPSLDGKLPTYLDHPFPCKRPDGPVRAALDVCGRVGSDVTEDDVAAENAFSGDVDDITWELDVDRWIDTESVLAPLPDTVDEVTGLDWEGLDEEGMVAHGDRITTAFENDLEAIARTTQTDSIVDRAAKALGKGIDVGSELIPYAGLAATGYALRTDIDDGKWGDAAADAILESLQLIEIADPELDVFVEPIMLVVAAVQMIGDAIWGWFHPQPLPPDWNTVAMDEALRGADALPGELWQAWRDERRSSFLEGTRSAVDGLDGHARGSVQPRLDMDLVVLGDLYLTMSRHLKQAQVAAERQGVTHEVAEAHFVAVMAKVKASVQRSANLRMAAYVVAGEQAVAKAVANPPTAEQFSALDKRFVEDVVGTSTAAMAANVWSVYYKTAPEHWDQLDPEDRDRVVDNVEQFVGTTSWSLSTRNAALGTEHFSYERADVDVTRDRLSRLFATNWTRFRHFIAA